MPEPSDSASRSAVITPSPPRQAAPRAGGDRSDPGLESAQETSRLPKCPYLAGRPPHGSFHLWPSGVNVCHARPREEKPYSHVSKETQAARCFGETEPFERCPDYERARARGIELPVFDGRVPSPPNTSEASPRGRHVRRERVKHRHRHFPLRRWLKENGRSTLICALCVTVALAVFSLLLRSM